MNKILKTITLLLLIIIMLITINNLLQNPNEPFWFNKTTDGINNTTSIGGIRIK